jgi:hypothetical protein
MERQYSPFSWKASVWASRNMEYRGDKYKLPAVQWRLDEMRTDASALQDFLRS